MRMSSMWPPMGMSGNSPLSGVVVCVNLGVRSHLGDHGHQEGLLELPMLGAPFNDSEHLCCKLLCLVAERRQTLDSFMVGAESVEDNGGMPSDV